MQEERERSKKERELREYEPVTQTSSSWFGWGSTSAPTKGSMTDEEFMQYEVNTLLLPLPSTTSSLEPGRGSGSQGLHSC